MKTTGHQHSAKPGQRLLVYEPRCEGHHLGWLRFVAEDFLSAGFEVSLAVDQSNGAREKVMEQLGSLVNQVRLLPAKDSRKESGAQALNRLKLASGAHSVFLNSFDEVASSWFRRAAFGLMPSENLRGRLGGIYFRPRMLASKSFGDWFKLQGLLRMLRQGWFARLLLLDEYLLANARANFPKAPFFFLPDVWPDDFQRSGEGARHYFGIAPERKVFLFYGGPYRRKGMHLALEAFLRAPQDKSWLLFCAGRQPEDPKLARQLEELVQRGQALSLNRYVSDEEEKLCMAAADFVLLPYIDHFGSSGVLSRATGAGKMVIASDEQLIGRRVREHDLGLLFRSGNSTDLLRAMTAAAALDASARAVFERAARRYAPTCSRSEFRAALLRSFGVSQNDSRNE